MVHYGAEVELGLGLVCGIYRVVHLEEVELVFIEECIAETIDVLLEHVFSSGVEREVF